MDWRHRAICRDEDLELFFPPDDGSDAAHLQAVAAKAVCRRCPVMAECRSWALDERLASGVFGGLTEFERRVIHDRSRRRDSASSDSPVRDVGELAAVTRQLLAEGHRTRQVAERLGVRMETVRRWARTPPRPAVPAERSA